MKSNLYFDECEDCVFRDCRDDTMICLSNQLSLAVFKFLKELPGISRVMLDSKVCHGFMRRVCSDNRRS